LKKKGPVDRFAGREASKYENPIPSRECITETLEAALGPLSHRALCVELSLNDEEHIEALRRRLIAMERDGQLVSNRKKAYGPVSKMDLVKGRIQGHKEGFGFGILADGSGDVYLTNRQMRKVFDGDEVLIRPEAEDSRGKREGVIVEVLSHNTHQLVGKFLSERGISLVRPDNPRIIQDVLVAIEDASGAEDGQLVVVEIIQQPSRYQRPTGRVVEVLGDHLAPGMEIEVSIRSHGIPHVWPCEVENEALAFNIDVADADKSHRVDLRHLPLVTIDGEDARDFDDAVYCEPKRSGGWRLYVAIADVAHYVNCGSALDQEALARGNSVYFPDFVVPMLPKVLSNGLCSLNPHVDRLCMVCEMTISAAGKISGYKFYEGVMHSHARLTYTQVADILSDQNADEKATREPYHSQLKHLTHLYDLYHVLRDTRDVRGAIDFETTETRIIFDAERKIKNIVPVQRNDAHKLIEECMLAANVCAAKFLEAHKVASLYRVHEPPKLEKLQMLREFLTSLGLGMSIDHEISPLDYKELLARVADRPDYNIIQTVLLRSMNQAVYTPENKGHFGLAYAAYAHFTSPIRRYPDLLVHRALKAIIHADLPSNKVKRIDDAPVFAFERSYPYSNAQILEAGEQCSLTERRADEATRDVNSWLKCEYLSGRIGESFDGVVSAVTGFGLFVELQEVFIEGLVHITSLPQDYYHFEAAQHRLVGERSHKIFRLGDPLRVKVSRVDLDERKIDFELLDVKPQARPTIKKRKKRR